VFDTPWSYTFTDALSGEELATLPMSGVAFDTKLSDVGQFAGVVPTVDPTVRARDPWAATAPRRTALFVEYEEEPVWGGLVTGRSRVPGTWGLAVRAATFESWLARTWLRADADLTAATRTADPMADPMTGGVDDGPWGAPRTLGELVRRCQAHRNASIRLAVASATTRPDTAVTGQVYLRADVKPLVDYFKSWVTRWGTPIEWRVDVERSGSTFSPTLIINEASFADGRTPWTLHYPGDLLSWSYEEDGTAQANVMVGAASGAGEAKLFSAATVEDLDGNPAGGQDSDEFDAGFPAQMDAYSVGGTNVGQDTLDTAVRERLLDRMAQGETLSGVSVRPTRQAIVEQQVGDPVDLEITHPAYREWPAVAEFTGYRITGKRVTVGGAGQPDQVALTVVPPADRLPASLLFPAQFRDMLARIRRLELGTPEV
jgi:hypothetical protein